MSEFNQKLLTSPIYWIINILAVIVIVVCKLFGSKIIGWFGELWTKQELDKLPKDKYKIINDIFISLNGITHQIDHVVISPYGIFSIETKQYNGYITGDKYDKYWVRHTKRKKYYYINPIRQNYGHVKSLATLLNIDEKKIHNIVCIPSNAKLKIKHDGELVKNTTIIDKIMSYEEVVLENIDEIVNIINNSNITDKKVKKEHIDNIKRKSDNKDPNKCPKCGGDLIERDGKYGLFTGCSNYPKCKYTRK